MSNNTHPPDTISTAAPICDAHVHFFSPAFLAALASQRRVGAREALTILEWDDPVSVDLLADRWLAELDRHGVGRTALIASVPGDEMSVAAATARHPDRLVGFFMLNPTQDDAVERTRRALDAGLRTICLFPAMHHYALTDGRVTRIFALAAERPGTAVFVHCGVLSIGARKKLGLPSPFDLGKGNPLDLHQQALDHPGVPIVIPHFGAGMLREALMVADLCPNIYLDTSSSNSWIRYTPGLTLEQVFATALDVVGPQRLLFGTDSSSFPRGWHRAIWQRQHAALQNLGTTPEAVQAIVGGNFNRLWPVATP